MSSKPQFMALLADLHALHLTDSVIAELTGRSRQYVRRTLNELGLTARWNKASSVRDELPNTMREACAQVRMRT